MISAEVRLNLEKYRKIDEARKRLEGYGYVFVWEEKIIKSPHGESGPRSFKELKNIFEAEEKMRLRSERIEKILGYDN